MIIWHKRNYPLWICSFSSVIQSGFKFLDVYNSSVVKKEHFFDQTSRHASWQCTVWYLKANGSVGTVNVPACLAPWNLLISLYIEILKRVAVWITFHWDQYGDSTERTFEICSHRMHCVQYKIMVTLWSLDSLTRHSVVFTLKQDWLEVRCLSCTASSPACE
jgi:hypothetical protein